ncbi:MAG: ABC transporter ATP-binding protein/permease [Ruminococcus sp.]|nr:ABC transporter ATP-binding protein/permease [Ruminococcus sp.]
MKKRSAIGIMARMIRLVKPLAGFMCLAVFLGVCGFLCAEFITIMGGYAMLDVLKFETPFSLKAVFVCVLLLAVFRAAFRCTEQYLNHYIAFTLLALIRDRVFKALRRLCPAKLEGRDKGDLISVITSDIELLEVFYAHTISPICIAAVMTVIMTIFIASQNVTLGLIALAAYICVGVVVPIVIFRLSGSTADEYRAQSGQLSAFVLENLRGLDETIQYNASESRINDLKLRADSLAVKQEKISRNMGLNAAITNSVILIFDLVMLFAGIALYNADSIGFSQLVISVIAMMSGFGPVVALANLGSVLQNTLASGNRVLDILDEQPVTDEITDGRDVSFTGANAQNVTFTYGEATILDDFTLGIEQGKITGIVGKSGSGKSTFLKLLMRFWETNQGAIKISGENINSINTKSLRNNESFVTQDTQLFHETIEYNVKIAKLGATHDEVVEACKKASIHDFIMTLPDGYDTQVGELGDTLSGGERQRIGLARAFLHNAPLMLLDEPTSNLDSLNEAVILKSLLDKDEDKTVVLVSHRPSTMRICDVAYSVENGRMS